LSLRLAQALHHGNDHRAQISIALTMLGVAPPALDAFTFGLQDGRVVEVQRRLDPEPTTVVVRNATEFTTGETQPGAAVPLSASRVPLPASRF
jgi:hypothetical protein